MSRLCLLVVGITIVLTGLDGATKRRNQCPRNRIGRQEFLDHVATGENFLGIYTIEINSDDMFGKTINVWDQTGGGINASTFTRNLDQSRCDEFLTVNSTITERRELRKSKCCRKRGKPIRDSYITLDKVGDRQQRFFSQDIESYFWWFQCFNGTVDEFRNCDVGYFDLQIPSINTTSELDISGVPWCQVAQDLKEFTGLKFGDSIVRFTWLGIECSE